jgi:hypothetical protein
MELLRQGFVEVVPGILSLHSNRTKAGSVSVKAKVTVFDVLSTGSGSNASTGPESASAVLKLRSRPLSVVTVRVPVQSRTVAFSS